MNWVEVDNGPALIQGSKSDPSANGGNVKIQLIVDDVVEDLLSNQPVKAVKDALQRFTFLVVKFNTPEDVKEILGDMLKRAFRNRKKYTLTFVDVSTALVGVRKVV